MVTLVFPKGPADAGPFLLIAMFRSLTLATLLLVFASACPAEAREWRSSDGARTFTADFVSTDGTRVTLKRSDGRIITFSLSKLHPDDQAWILTRQRPRSQRAGGSPPPDPQGAAFGDLEFGDSRGEVQEKLEKSALVEASVSETFFGRTGLNGVYRTKATIGGLKCYLYFDWTKGGSLREVTLQTQPKPASSYASLQANWNELIDLLNKLHGKPVQSSTYPPRGDLQDGLILGSHLWRTEEGHSVILGTGQERDQYNVVVRITSEVINPVPLSGGSEAPAPKGPIFPD